ncbi:MAG: hypothetical protein GTO46_04415 [Gemmatimonadetes bacterium]|nr:hypothetical protein [Gemmatimonadota bacterium]NIO30968.1 hypothetical protein [Gemmatimonadota bacterium]
MKEAASEKREEKDRLLDTGGPPCGEAQPDGVPCEELERDCEDCEQAEPEAREVYKARGGGKV